MSWQKWVLVTIFAFGALNTVFTAGAEREPIAITPGMATAIVVLEVLLIWLAVTA